MRKSSAVFFVFLLLISCKSKYVNELDKKNVGQKITTLNPNLGYYRHGYKSVEIWKMRPFTAKDSTIVNVLKFNSTSSSMCTQEVLFNKFGKWNLDAHFNHRLHPVLIWENVQLFKNSSEKYYIVVP